MNIVIVQIALVFYYIVEFIHFLLQGNSINERSQSNALPKLFILFYIHINFLIFHGLLNALLCAKPFTVLFLQKKSS